MSNYKVIQMTNNNIGVIAINGFMPFGRITRRKADGRCCNTFTVSNSNADIIYLNESGRYNITYSASLVATAAGIMNINLVVNNDTVYTVSTTAAAGDTVNVTLPWQVRVGQNCNGVNNCPADVQIQVTGVAVTSGTSNILIEKVE
jgi:hypothetical protein